MKILSPAGNMDSLKTAIQNGADEVYLGVNEFNARNNIDGFDMNSLQSAVQFAHIYGVKVNLAINILFDDCELQSALDVVVKAYNMGVDYFIIQDLGLIALINKYYPQVVVHASTQMGLHNLEGVEFVEKYGIRRVVLARETPLSEIERIDKNTDVEIEYFAHGALCVSFSGNCYLSSYLFNASGNRGRCKQLCRLPYTLAKNGKKVKSGYLLSAKDFNMTKRIDDLKKAGVDVLKIEGRARRPFYVGASTKEYSNVLNGKKADQNRLELAFNRSFTEGYFNGNNNVISKFNNHFGVYLGKVVKVNNGKNFNEIFLNSSVEIAPKSTLKIVSDLKEKTTLSAYDVKRVNGSLYRFTTTHKIDVGNEVRLIADAKAESDLLSSSFKRDVKVSLYVKQDEQICATVNTGNKEFVVKGVVLERAQKSPLTKEDFIESFAKNEYLSASINFICFDNVFMPKSKLNEFRRKVFNECINVLLDNGRTMLQPVKINKNLPFKKLENYQTVYDLDDKFDKKHVIYSPETYSVEDVKRFVSLAKKQGLKPYLDTPNFALESDVKLLKKIVQETGVGVVANNYYSLKLTSDLIIGAGLNVYNTHTANLLNAPIMTAEGDLCERAPFAYMTLRHCPMKEHLSSSCEKCVYESGFEYITDSGKALKLKRKKLSSCTFYLTE